MLQERNKAPQFSAVTSAFCHNCQDRRWVDVEPGQKISNEFGEHSITQTTDKTRSERQPCPTCKPEEYTAFWQADEARRQLWFPK